MLTEICQYLKNWFDRDQAKFYGKFFIEDGELQSYNDGDMDLIEGQYIRIIGSLLNDGVHQVSQSSDTLVDETFEGAVWSMAIPPAVLALSKDISDWQTKYGSIESQAMSPFQSESFGGYSYTKSAGSSGLSGDGGKWQDVFAKRLSPWRKII